MEVWKPVRHIHRSPQKGNCHRPRLPSTETSLQHAGRPASENMSVFCICLFTTPTIGQSCIHLFIHHSYHWPITYSSVHPPHLPSTNHVVICSSTTYTIMYSSVYPPYLPSTNHVFICLSTIPTIDQSCIHLFIHHIYHRPIMYSSVHPPHTPSCIHLLIHHICC